MTPDNKQEEFGHWAKHGGPTTWCGVPVSTVQTISRAGLRRAPPHPGCVEAFNEWRSNRMQATREAFAAAGITPEYLNSREPTAKTPDTATPSWWAQYRVGLHDGLQNLYRPRSPVAAAHGYDAGHADGINDIRIQQIYDGIEEDLPDG